ncbi:lysylphosphatidylglycerol synthase domain-containing protein [Gemella cuniculi]|uniref:lysylphosphatidylglycerol synthase domain-containing protein n=1 Tax=Gemella cuniculi TaxID=150240 RepID=UPI0003FF6D1D|nr:lysylphosphatidylglycerol synthase domain-containing protein [Gemella cuniculi]
MNITKDKKSLNYLKNIAQMVLGLLIFYLIFSYFKKEITSLDFKQIRHLTLQLGNVKFFFVLLCGLFGITILCLYDYFVLKAINLAKHMSSFRIFKISFMTNTLNMVLGFGGFIGAGLRYYMYRPYAKSGKTLVTAIGMILVSMLSGISLLSIFVIFNVFPGQALYSENKIFYYCLILMSVFLPLYLFVSLKKPKIRGDKYLSVKLTIISFLEWVFAAIIILIILYFYTGDLVYNKELQIVGVIIIASIIGLLTMVPGGLGTFDTLVLIGLKNLGINPEIIGATIIIYRLAYYVIPFSIGCLMFVSEGIRIIRDKFTKRGEKYDN